MYLETKVTKKKKVTKKHKTKKQNANITHGMGKVCSPGVVIRT